MACVPVLTLQIINPLTWSQTFDTAVPWCFYLLIQTIANPHGIVVNINRPK